MQPCSVASSQLKWNSHYSTSCCSVFTSANPPYCCCCCSNCRHHCRSVWFVQRVLPIVRLYIRLVNVCASRWTYSSVSDLPASHIYYAYSVHVTIHHQQQQHQHCLTYWCAMFDPHIDQHQFAYIQSARVFDNHLLPSNCYNPVEYSYNTVIHTSSARPFGRRRCVWAGWQSSDPRVTRVHWYTGSLARVELQSKPAATFCSSGTTTSSWCRCLLEYLVPLLLISANMVCVASVPLARSDRLPHPWSIGPSPQPPLIMHDDDAAAQTTSPDSRPASSPGALRTAEPAGTTEAATASTVTPLWNQRANEPRASPHHRLTSGLFNSSLVIKIYMRSQRTRRSLEYYMSNGDRAPLLLTSGGRSTRSRYFLSITDDAQVQLINSDIQAESPSLVQQALMTVSIIVEHSQLTSDASILSSFQPHDNARVIVRRFGTNICLCMASSGIVGTERLINDTVTDNCEWRLRVSRHGIGLEHVLYSDELLPSSDTKSPMPAARPAYRIATLSTQSSNPGLLASGWLHKLWHPQATWQVYSANISTILHTVTPPSPAGQANASDVVPVDTKLNDSVHNIVQQGENPSSTTGHGGGKGNSSSSAEERAPIKVGGREVWWLQALAQDINNLHRTAQQKHCVALIHNLSSTVQHELSASLKIMDNFRLAFRRLDASLRAKPPHELLMPGTYNTVSQLTLASLFDQWLAWTDLRWQSKIKRLARKSHTTDSSALTCSLSFAPTYADSIRQSDASLVAMVERHAMTKIYHDLFLQVQHMASWSPTERRRWLRHPRLPALLRYLDLRVPSAAQLRQATFVLRRYLPTFAPDTQKQLPPSLTYGINGTFGITELKKLLSDRASRTYLLNRAVALKFEELLFWPRPVRQATGRVLEHTPIASDLLRSELQLLGPDDYCYTRLLALWHAQRRKESPVQCVDHSTQTVVEQAQRVNRSLPSDYSHNDTLWRHHSRFSARISPKQSPLTASTSSPSSLSSTTATTTTTTTTIAPVIPS